MIQRLLSILTVTLLMLALPAQVALGSSDDDAVRQDDICDEVLEGIENGTADTSDLTECLNALQEAEVLENIPEVPVEEDPPEAIVVEEDTFPEDIPDEVPEDPEERRSVVRQVVFAPITIARNVADRAGWDAWILDEIESDLVNGVNPLIKLTDQIREETGVDLRPMYDGFEETFGGLVPELPDFTQEDADAVEEQYSE